MSKTFRIHFVIMLDNKIIRYACLHYENVKSSEKLSYNKWNPQECMPVGCVPPALVAVPGGKRSAQPSPPPTLRGGGQTNTCESITFPQLCNRAVIMSKLNSAYKQKDYTETCTSMRKDKPLPLVSGINAYFSIVSTSQHKRSRARRMPPPSERCKRLLQRHIAIHQ